MILPDDRNLFTFTNSVDAAAREITSFYNNYHSQQYVNGKLILRLKHEPTEELTAQLNEEFSDILVSGTIDKIEATDHERADDDNVELPRVRLHFDRRHLGRLRSLVDRLNAAAADDAVAADR